jgi:general secretion pathway protein H
MLLKKINGFTLIEIMVVIVIIGVVLSFAMLSISDGGQARKMEQEAQRLASLLTLASQEAIMQGYEMGISFNQNSYRFYVLQEHKWQALTARDDIFRTRALPLGMQIEINVEGEPIVLDKAINTPQLLLLSSGEFTPFIVTFISESDAILRYQLTGTMTGDLNGEW